MPIVGLEPSCTAVLRGDLLELLPGDPRAVAVARETRTLAELLSAPAPIGPDPDAGWTLPDLSDVTPSSSRTATSTPSWGSTPTARCWSGPARRSRTLAGCCGLAGNFGMEKGHYEVSVAVAEHALLPALRAAAEGDVFLADGFSCRTQAEELVGVRGTALAELLADRLPGAGAPTGGLTRAVG